MFDAQAALENWWNEDPEMRYAEIMCGENLRVRVSLFQIDPSKDEPVRVGHGETGTLLEAVRLAIRHGK